MVDKQTFELANKLWNYHHVNQSLEKSDCILVLGSHDLRVAERGAELYLQGLAPIIIFSGGLGNFTKEIWDEPEADKFATVAMNMGVPRGAILIENKSLSTLENLLNSNKIIQKRKIKKAVPEFTSDNPELAGCLNRLWQKQIGNDLPILTDDYAPVEYYVSKLL